MIAIQKFANFLKIVRILCQSFPQYYLVKVKLLFKNNYLILLYQLKKGGY